MAQQRFYVDPTSTGPQIGDKWTQAFHTVQAALGAAGNTPFVDEIWVAQGTYTPGITQTSTFTLKNNVKLFGGFTGYGNGTGSQESSITQRPYPPLGSILSGDIDGIAGSSPGDCEHVVTIPAGIALSTLDGFAIRSGYADGGNQNGAGILMAGTSGQPIGPNVLLSELRIRDNKAYQSGGGIYSGSPAPLVEA